MRNRVLLAGAAGLLAVLGGGTVAATANASTAATAPTVSVAPVGATEPTTRPPNSNDALELGVLSFVNAIRGENRCGFLQDSDRLNGAARSHAADMAERNFLGHVSPDGVTTDIRIAHHGFRAAVIGENIAKGFTNPHDVVFHWMDNPKERANILNCDFTHIGVGVASAPDGTLVWTQDFAALR
jgi:uncharacterized protein YkwD